MGDKEDWGVFFFCHLDDLTMASLRFRKRNQRKNKGKSKEQTKENQRNVQGNHYLSHLSLVKSSMSLMSLQSSFRSLPRIQIARIRFAGGSPGAPGEMDARDLYSVNASKT